MSATIETVRPEGSDPAGRDPAINPQSDFIRLKPDPVADVELSSMGEAWRAATTFAGADLSLAIAGTGRGQKDAAIFGTAVDGGGICQADAAALFTALRKEVFTAPHGNETVILDHRALAALAADDKAAWLRSYSSLAACRVEGRRGDRFVAAFLRRETPDLPFHADEVRHAAAILRHCAFSQRQARRLDVQRRSALRCLNAVAMPLFLVDSELKCLFGNREGERLLRKADGLTRDAGHHLVTDRPATTKLLRDAVAGGQGRTLDHVCSLVMPEGRRLVLAIRSFPAEDGLDGGVIAAFPQRSANFARRRAFFEAAGLLRSEAKFLSELSKRGTPSGAAEALDLSEETGRTYVKRILGKLDLRNQFELGRFVGRYQIPFSDFGGPQ